jgi:AcrR family transcriptional regulator
MASRGLRVRQEKVYSVHMQYNVKDKKSYHHGNLRDALIAAGRDLIEKHGQSELSLRKCAGAIGVSPTAPQNHFGNKTGLLTAMAAQGYEELAALMVKGLRENANRTERRRAALLGYVSFVQKNPALYELMFSRNRVLADDPELIKHVGAGFAILADVSKDLGLFESDNPQSDAKAQMFVWSLIHGYAQLATANRFKKADMQGLDILDILPVDVD